MLCSLFFWKFVLTWNSARSSENTSKAQVEELKLQRTMFNDHHFNHKALQTEHQITLQSLKYSLYLSVLLISADQKKMLDCWRTK
jgi:hypothetical protein